MRRCKTLLVLAALGAMLLTGGWTPASPTGLVTQQSFAADSGFYRLGDELAEPDTGVPEGMLDYAAAKFQYVYDTFLADTGSHVYLSVIPTKHAFLFPDGPHADADDVAAALAQRAPFLETLSLDGLLTIDDYYATDLHWKQENILPVAQHLGQSMGVDITGEGLEEVSLLGDFRGNYQDHHKTLPIPADTLTLLRAPWMADCTVTNIDLMGRPAPGVMYDALKARQRYLYDMYLSGPQGLVTVENPHATTDKELILFRDSFGSSLAPLLAEGYARITLVDLRYMSSFLLGEYMDFHGQDVLFLYSTLLLNNSMALK